MTLSCRTCGSRDVELVGDNGVTDPADGDRRETYECLMCSETFTEVLHA